MASFELNVIAYNDSGVKTVEHKFADLNGEAGLISSLMNEVNEKFGQTFSYLYGGRVLQADTTFKTAKIASGDTVFAFVDKDDQLVASASSHPPPPASSNIKRLSSKLKALLKTEKHRVALFYLSRDKQAIHAATKDCVSKDLCFRLCSSYPLIRLLTQVEHANIIFAEYPFLFNCVERLMNEAQSKNNVLPPEQVDASTPEQYSLDYDFDREFANEDEDNESSPALTQADLGNALNRARTRQAQQQRNILTPDMLRQMIQNVAAPPQAEAPSTSSNSATASSAPARDLGVERLKEMGVDEDAAREVLAAVDDDVDRAIDLLFN